jgi:hypothetical protein
MLALDRSIAARGAVRRWDADGRLCAVANISKAMVSPYQAREIPAWQSLGLDPRRTYQLLRDPAELKRAAASFDGLPLLIRHVPVSAEGHPRELVVGTIGTDAAFRDPYLVATVTVWDAGAIDAIESGHQRELSCGYHYVPVMESGIFDGKRFDGVDGDSGKSCCVGR